LALPYAVRRAATVLPSLSPAAIRDRLAYATYVSTARRYLYCEVPKAACTSLKTLMHKVEGLPRIETLKGSLRETRRDMFIHDRGQFRMPSLLDFDDAQQEHILSSPEYFRFTVVRNPYTRLESAWNDKVRTCAPNYEYLYRRIKGDLPRSGDPSSIISLEEFVAVIAQEDLFCCNHHWRLQTANTLYPVLNFTHVGHLEALQETLDRFLAHVGRSDLERPHDMNRTGSASCYTAALAERVHDLYSADFEAFGYDPTSWPRGARSAACGATPAVVVSERKYLEEITERNVVIGRLYEERENLQQAISVKSRESVIRHARAPFDSLFDWHIAPIEGWISRDEARLGYELGRSVSNGCIVEIGSYRGRTTVALAFGSLGGWGRPVFAIEPHELFVGRHGAVFDTLDRGHFMRRMLELGLFHVVRLVNLESQFLGPSWPHPVSVLWIDADHRYEIVSRDIAHWRKFLTHDASLVLREAVEGDSGPARAVAELLAGGEFEHVTSIGKLVHLRRCRGLGHPTPQLGKTPDRPLN
jgi:hypothetical protein